MAEVYRADNVGSLLRPAEVKEARGAFQSGHISRDRLSEVEDRAVLTALDRQRQAGIDVYSDREYRRAGFQNDLAESVEGYV